MSYFGTFSQLPNIAPHLPVTTYGDVIIRKSLTNNKPECSVQHNYAEFVNRRGLIPYVAGFHTPFLNFNDEINEDAINSSENSRRITKNKSENFEVRKNLLCSELLESYEGIKIFSAANRSRTTLNISEVKFISSSDSNNKDDIIQLDGFSANINTKHLKKKVVELKLLENEMTTKKLFIRHENGLDLYDNNEEKFENVFETKIEKFFQFPGLDDEIAILDENKWVWYGTLGENMTRKKTNYLPNDITATTCPRILLLGNVNSAKLLDVRDNKPDAKTIFNLPQINNEYTPDSYMQTIVGVYKDSNDEKILHTTAVNQREYSAIITTNYYHYLIDQRVPGKSIITVPHCVLQDDAYCFTTSGIKDPITNNFIHSFISMSHSDNNIHYWPLLIDTTHNMWSSISSIKTTPTTKLIEEYCETSIDLSNLNPYQLPKEKISVCYQDLPQTITSKSTSLLIHQMEDDSLWYSNYCLNFKNDENDIDNMRLNSVKLILNYYKELKEHDPDDVKMKKITDEECLAEFIVDENNFPELDDNYSILNDDYRITNINKYEENDFNLLDFIPRKEFNDKDHTITKIIIKQWNKVVPKANGYFKQFHHHNIDIESLASYLESESISSNADNSLPTRSMIQEKIDTNINNEKFESMTTFNEEDEDNFDYGELPC